MPSIGFGLLKRSPSERFTPARSPSYWDAGNPSIEKMRLSPRRRSRTYEVPPDEKGHRTAEDSEGVVHHPQHGAGRSHSIIEDTRERWPRLAPPSRITSDWKLLLRQYTRAMGTPLSILDQQRFHTNRRVCEGRSIGSKPPADHHLGETYLPGNRAQDSEATRRHQASIGSQIKVELALRAEISGYRTSSSPQRPAIWSVSSY